MATQAIVTNTRTADTCYYVLWVPYIEMGATTSSVVVIVAAASDRAPRVHIFIAVWIVVYFVNLLYFIIISVFTFNVSVSIFLSLWVGRSVISIASFSIFPCARLCVSVWESVSFSHSSHQSKDDERKTEFRRKRTLSKNVADPFDRLFSSIRCTCLPLIVLFSSSSLPTKLLLQFFADAFDSSQYIQHPYGMWTFHESNFLHSVRIYFVLVFASCGRGKRKFGGSIFVLDGAAHSAPLLLARRLRRTVNEYVFESAPIVCRRTQFIISCCENYWSMKETIEFSSAVEMVFFFLLAMHFAWLQQLLWLFIAYRCLL